MRPKTFAEPLAVSALSVIRMWVFPAGCQSSSGVTIVYASSQTVATRWAKSAIPE